MMKFGKLFLAQDSVRVESIFPSLFFETIDTITSHTLPMSLLDSLEKILEGFGYIWNYEVLVRGYIFKETSKPFKAESYIPNFLLIGEVQIAQIL